MNDDRTEEQLSQARAKLIKEYPHLTPLNSTDSPSKIGLKNLRAQLKEEGITSSVRVERYAGGETIHVAVLDGNLTDKANSIAKKYQVNHFDGMTDSTDYIATDFTKTFGELDRTSTYVAEGDTRAKLDGTYKAPEVKVESPDEIYMKFLKGATRGTESTVAKYLPAIKERSNPEGVLSQAWRNSVLAFKKNDGAIKALVEGGQDPNEQTRYMGVSTLLQLSLAYDKFELANTLLEHGANPNGHLIKGDTALHMVRSPKVAQNLIDKGASLDTLNKREETPLQTAMRENRLDVAQVIREAQAEQLKEQIKQALADRPPMVPELAYGASNKRDGFTSTKGKARRM